WRDAGASLALADAWCLAQIHVRSRLGGRPTLEDIARRTRVPAEVLAPAFTAAMRRGYFVDDANVLSLTERGEEQGHLLIDARRRWLARELSDWGAEDDDLLNLALD